VTGPAGEATAEAERTAARESKTRDERRIVLEAITKEWKGRDGPEKIGRSPRSPKQQQSPVDGESELRGKVLDAPTLHTYTWRSFDRHRGLWRGLHDARRCSPARAIPAELTNASIYWTRVDDQKRQRRRSGPSLALSTAVLCLTCTEFAGRYETLHYARLHKRGSEIACCKALMLCIRTIEKH
jgi:hypothetical protein